MLRKARVVTPLAMIAMMLILSACSSPPGPSAPASPLPEGRTGIAELDAIIAAVLEGGAAELASLVDYTESKCTLAEGLGGPPKCLPGEQEGTVVEVLPFLGPEGSFIRKADISTWQGIDVSDLHAVYEVSDAAYSDPDYPAGEYALVFTGGASGYGSVTLQVTGGRIVRIDYGLRAGPEIRSQDVVRYLVPPG